VPYKGLQTYSPCPHSQVPYREMYGLFRPCQLSAVQNNADLQSVSAQLGTGQKKLRIFPFMSAQAKCCTENYRLIVRVRTVKYRTEKCTVCSVPVS
jgi:hypothetical protein